MLNRENILNLSKERIKTRSAEVSPEEILYLEINYIDNYYSKKKKNLFDRNIKNDLYSSTKSKEDVDSVKAVSNPRAEVVREKEKIIKSKKEPEKKNDVANGKLDQDSILNSNLEILQNKSGPEADNTEKKKIKKTSPKKSDSPKKKQSKIFTVENIPGKKSNSKISNGKNLFKNPVDIIKQKRSKKTAIDNTNTNDSQSEISNSIMIQDINRFQGNKDLFIIYDEFNKLKFLGKKRNSVSFELNNSELCNYYSNRVFFTKFNYDDSYSITKNKLKENLNSVKFNEIFETLYVLKERREDKKTENYLFNIPNSYDTCLRREDANKMSFIKLFQEDYAPIKLQKDNERLFEKLENEEKKQNNFDTSTATSTTTNTQQNTKTHFIRKKQSAINIKRQCGVSYVVETESNQLNVEDQYKKLGHLVYQGTHSVDQINDENIIEFIDDLIVRELINKPILAVAFESADEEEMREFLLYPEKRLEIAKEVFIIKSIEEIWKFSKDKLFFAVNLIFDAKCGVRNFTIDEIINHSPNGLLAMSNIHIGILFRRATSGIKSVLKLYKSGGIEIINHKSTYKMCNLNENEHIDKAIEDLSGMNMTTLSMRMELYVPEKEWKSSNVFCKEFLYTFMCQLEEKMASLILNWNEYRYTMYLLAKDQKVRDYLHTCPFFTINMKLDKQIPINNSNFILDKQSFSDIKFNEKASETKTDLNNSTLLIDNHIKSHNSFADKLSLISNLSFNNTPLPMYIISTRDCFVFDLLVKSEIFEFEGRKILKKEFFFDENNIPSNYHKFRSTSNDLNVGVVTYENYYTNEELKDLEGCVEKTEEYSMKDAFLPETAQKTFYGDRIKRTKFFFGSRYMWTKKQLSEPNSYVGAGIRKDVSPPPYWMKEKVEQPLVKAGIILKDFINSFALNVYHDGSEGLGQHFDDAVRFKQPIYTLRLFSDCRLSFGSQLYGFCNGAFTIPLPRGCICIMEENSYASNGVKHCIRPCDMTGKSSALILRQMHPAMINEAEKYDYYIDFPSWFSSLSVNPNAVSYMEQKSIEADMLIKIAEIEKKKINTTSSDAQIVDVVTNLLNSVEYYMDSYLPSINPSFTKKKRGKGGKDY